MSLFLKPLTTFGNAALPEVRERIKTLPVTRYGPVNASGYLYRRLAFQVVALADDGARLTFTAPWYALYIVYGRKPGKMPPVVYIQEWMATKGITAKPDANGKTISQKSLAFLIARGIAKKGTVLHQQGQPSDLFMPLHAGPAREALRAGIVATFKVQIVQSLR